MSAILAVRLPIPDVRTLSPNGRAHWGAKYKAGEEAFIWAALATIEALAGREPINIIEPFSRYELRLIWRLAKYGKVMDDDNAKAAMKAYRDGIAQVLNLNDRCMAWARDIEWRRGETPGITIEVWPIA